MMKLLVAIFLPKELLLLLKPSSSVVNVFKSFSKSLHYPMTINFFKIENFAFLSNSSSFLSDHFILGKRTFVIDTNLKL
jgi:hypothetical protein